MASATTTQEQPRLDHSKLTPMNKSATWDERKKACIAQAQQMYPHIPIIALEASYDFAVKYEHDETVEKFFTGGKLTAKQMKKVDKILNPASGKKVPCKVWDGNETIQGITIRQMTEEEKEMYKPLPLEPVGVAEQVNDDFETLPEVVESGTSEDEKLSNTACEII